MSVFLIVLISVLLFIPGTLEPFTQGGQDDIVTANRIGDQLAEGTLGSPSEPHVLNATCTRFFFRGEDKSFCRYSGDTLQERLGVQDRRFVNITLRGDINGSKGEAILCWGEPTAGHPRLFERRVDPASCETRFAIGPNPTNNERSTVTARRVVTLNRSAGSSNKTAVALVVEVW